MPPPYGGAVESPFVTMRNTGDILLLAGALNPCDCILPPDDGACKIKYEDHEVNIVKGGPGRSGATPGLWGDAEIAGRGSSISTRSGDCTV